MTANSSAQRLKVLEAASNIIEYINRNGSVGVSELAAELDLPKSTAHIYLSSLEEYDFLTKAEGRYDLSLHFMERGAHVRRQYNIYNAGKPEVDKLAKETGEVANIGVHEDGQRVLLYKAEGSDAIYDNSSTGTFTNMHWTSLGKAIMAQFSRDRVERIIDEHGLPSVTEHTITDRERLFSELEEIREQGYALEDEENNEAIRAIAVPIHQRDEIQGAISISGPKARFSDDRIHNELLDLIQECANVIELKLRHY